MADNSSTGNQGNKEAKAKFGPIGIKALTSKPIDLTQYVGARKNEILSMRKSMRASKKASNKRAFQTLPRFLRRRTASYNPNRVPLRLRQKAIYEVQNFGMKVKKRSKRFKLIAKNRKKEYLRRQKNKTWLETHIWHAKRMHMKVMWGYSLAQKATFKNFRTLYRAKKVGSTIYDLSYNAPIELVGQSDVLINFLKCFLDPTDIPIGSKRISTGKRFHNTFLYSYLKYPYDLICPIQLLWCPKKDDIEKSKIWLFLHASCHDFIIDHFNEHIQKQKVDIEIIDLKSKLNIFQLNGPKAINTLINALDVCNEEDSNLKNNKGAQKLWPLFSSNGVNENFPVNSVLALTVHDPRLRGSPKNHNKIKSELNEQKQNELHDAFINWSNELANSEIWDYSNLDKPLIKVSEKSINSRKSKLLVPRSNLIPTPNDARIPILLIRTSTYSHHINNINNNNGDGWLLILPSNWGNEFWKVMVFNNTLPSGLRDFCSKYFECGLLAFPNDYPTTDSYDNYMKDKFLLNFSKYKRTPKSKRVNFDKINVKYPFRPNFHSLGYYQQLNQSNKIDFNQVQIDKVDSPIKRKLNEEIDDGKTKKSLTVHLPSTETSQSLTSSKLWSFQGNNVSKWIKEYIDLNQQNYNYQKFKQDIINYLLAFAIKRQIELSNLKNLNFDLGLIPVHLDLLDAGATFNNGIIYIIDQQYYNDLAINHINDDTSILDDKKTNSLHHIPNDKNIIGYITTGQYSLTLGKARAIGYVSFNGLDRIVSNDLSFSRKNKFLVFVRATTSPTARLAKLDFI